MLAFGVRVLLETRPVDPRDFLRGDYVTLDYVISDVHDKFSPGEDFPEEKKQQNIVYVTLLLDDKGVASVSGASFSRPREGLYLQGWLDKRAQWVDYGLGVYYVPEGTGRELEDMLRDPNAKVLADVRVFRGRGVIKKLEVIK
jgi:uncharacterized membrane-anchored protein